MRFQGWNRPRSHTAEGASMRQMAALIRPVRISWCDGS
jgi:hypothetical protein